MALKIRQSPLPQRIDPLRPRRHWIWTEPGPYDAVLMRDMAAALRLLHHRGRLLRLEDGGLCLIFDDPVELDPAVTPALVLRRFGADSYASYRTDAPLPRGVSIIMQGAPQVLDLDRATPVDPIDFWDFSQMPVREGRAPPLVPTQLPKVGRAQSDSAPQLAPQLRAALGRAEPFSDIRSKVGDARDSTTRVQVGRVAYFGLRLVATLAIVGVVLLVATGAVRAGGFIGAIWGLFLLLYLFGRPFGLRGLGSKGAAGKGTGAGGPQAGRQRRGGGFFDRLRGLALWNSALGDNLRRDIQRHLDQVNKMIDQGDVDRALKRAMSLARKEAADQNRKSRLITSPPKARANLDFDLGRNDADTVAIPGDWGFEPLRDKYQKLAQDLSAQGDHRRAAFIYAELLDMTQPALEELEKIKAFEDAAKLATARKSPGATIARLWFLAGRKDIALVMARRHNCMEQLANLSKKDADFATLVRQQWIQDLITQGALPKAVQESADHPRLAEMHLRVLALAVGAGHLHDHPVLERAVQHLPWPIRALDQDMSDDTVGGLVAGAVRAGLTRLDAGEIRQVLFAAVDRMEDSDPRKPALADAVVRASLAFDAQTAFAKSTSDLRRFAKAQGCHALAEDLRQIQRAGPVKPKSQVEIRLPQSGHGTWTMVAALPQGGALVGAQSGGLAYIDAQGVRRWTDHMPDLVGLVPIKAGRLVLILQGAEASRRISVLDTARRTYRALGTTRLLAWDGYAGDGGWHVQTPDAVGALDLTKLLDETPSFEMLWSITQTIPVKVIAFNSDPSRVMWLTQRIEPHGAGIIEEWSLLRSTLNLSVELENTTALLDLMQCPHVWRDRQYCKQRVDDKQRARFWFRGTPSTLDAEQSLLKSLGRKLYDRDRFASVTAIPDEAPLAVEISDTARSSMTLRHKEKWPMAEIAGHEIVAQSSVAHGARLVVLTKSGLVIFCDFKAMGVVAV